MSVHFDRAWLLIGQSRPELAEQEARRGLAESPDDARGHAVLAMSLAHQEKLKEATEAVQTAIQSAPDEPFVHHILAAILHDRHRPEEALPAIQEAIRLDPEDANHYALLGAIRLQQTKWVEALDAAQEGLTLDPEHVRCANVRATALVKLGRKAEAAAALQAALAREPDNSHTHANRGWSLLHEGKSREAMESFREALRLDPGNEWAQAGIVEALKARHLIYGLMLRYFLWMGRLSPRARWGLVLGGYFGAKGLGTVARENPPLAPFIAPLLIFYLLFVFLTWTASPLFNLLLRLNRFGRLALSREQVIASNWVGGFLLLAILSLAGRLVFGLAPLAIAALVFGLLTMPLAGTFSCSRGWPRTAMALYTGAMGAVGMGSVAVGLWAILLASDSAFEAYHELPSTLLSAFLIAFLASPWVANILMMKRVRR
jgi:tetratricopeptide (TPR) repeat protein